MATKSELVTALGTRYGSAEKAEKTRILDEFVAVTGFHRKHAIRLLRPDSRPICASRKPRRRLYGEELREALVVLWEASDRVCSKRLKPLIPVLVPALERHSRLSLAAEARDRLLTMSPATMDRLLSDIRAVARGGQRRRAGLSSAVRRDVPIRTFAEAANLPPGCLEVDFVAHCGTATSGSFVQSLVLTDVATGWTECVPVVVREGGLVIEAIATAMELFPFPVRSVDFDNDSAFMNEVVVGWCRGQGLQVTRSRAYHKNDQAWVEQKNGAIVRRLVGYGRLEGIAAAEALRRLYAAARLHVNLFLPSFKLREKKRIGARVIKRYHDPVPPVARVLGHPVVNELDKTVLRRLQASCDPILLLGEIKAAQIDLGNRVDKRGIAGSEAADPTVVDIPILTDSFRTAWRDGERRPTHKRPYRRRKPVPRRPRMLDMVMDQITGWLEQNPATPAKDILDRLMGLYPGRFTASHIRTVQRTVRAWRVERAHQVITSILASAPRVQAPPRQGLNTPHDTSIFGNILS